MIGDNLGPYRIVERLGRGGMATVYKAYQPSLDRYVAVKMLPAHLTDESGFTLRFKREARAVAKLEHPHILAVYDYGSDDDLTYIVMRYVEGGTLKELLGKPMELPRIVMLIDQVAEALDHAHKHGVVHRDVKPSNILLDHGDWALLTDFGVARMVEISQQLTGTGVGIGTPAYMSPEQGQGKKVDRRSDVYSLGVMLYEMLTGRVPFEADTPLAVVWKHVNDPLPLPRSIEPSIPESAERAVLKAMAKSPEDRYPSAGELAGSIREGLRRIEAKQEKRAPGTTLRRAGTAGVTARKQGVPGWIKWAIPAVLAIASISFFFLADPLGTLSEDRSASPMPAATSPSTEGAQIAPEQGPPATEWATAVATAATATHVSESGASIGTADNPIKLIFSQSQELSVIEVGGKVMTDWLTDATGLSFKIDPPANLNSAIDELCTGLGAGLAVIPSQAYVLANSRCGVEAAAATVRFGYPWYASMVLVPRLSGATTIEDLGGLTWGIPSYASTSGYVSPSVIFAQAGVEADEIIEFGAHNLTVEALYNGEVDFATVYYSPPLTDPPWQFGDDPEPFDPGVCAQDEGGRPFCGGIRVMDARTTIIESAPDVFEELRILTLGPQMPNDPVVFSSQFPEALRQVVLDALIEFGSSEACGLSVCEIFGWAGFEVATDSSYNPVRDLIITLDYSEQDILGE